MADHQVLQVGKGVHVLGQQQQAAMDCNALHCAVKCITPGPTYPTQYLHTVVTNHQLHMQ